jgi:excisionase family DNA binding protein
LTRRRELSDHVELLTVEEVARILRLKGRSTVDSMVKSGALASIRVGRLVRIPRAAVAKLIGAEDRG